MAAAAAATASPPQTRATVPAPLSSPQSVLSSSVVPPSGEPHQPIHPSRPSRRLHHTSHPQHPPLSWRLPPPRPARSPSRCVFPSAGDKCPVPRRRPIGPRRRASGAASGPALPRARTARAILLFPSPPRHKTKPSSSPAKRARAPPPPRPIDGLEDSPAATLTRAPCRPRSRRRREAKEGRRQAAR